MDRFVFPKSFYESIKTFKPASREALYSAIFGFIFDDKETELKSVDLQRVWMLIYPILSKAKKISTTMSRQSNENVERMSGETNENVKTISRVSSFKEKDKEKDKEKEKKEEKRTPVGVGSASASPVVRFIKPTLDQVKEHIQEKGYHFDAESFYAFYESKGWKVGNQSMKSWQMACITWEKRMPHTDQEPEVKKKPVPEVTQCPDCGSYDLGHSLDRVMCKSCGACYDYNHTKEKWVRA